MKIYEVIYDFTEPFFCKADSIEQAKEQCLFEHPDTGVAIVTQLVFIVADHFDSEPTIYVHQTMDSLKETMSMCLDGLEETPELTQALETISKLTYEDILREDEIRIQYSGPTCYLLLFWSDLRG